jgi:hypothetical protein
MIDREDLERGIEPQSPAFAHSITRKSALGCGADIIRKF